MGRGGVACPKPEKTIKQLKARAKRQKGNRAADVRVYVFGRERDLCRCCRKRPADSMHELRFRSLGGKVSRANSIAVCGSGTTGCHGHLQGLRIGYLVGEYGAEADVIFTPHKQDAADWMQIALGQSVKSDPMVYLEAAE